MKNIIPASAMLFACLCSFSSCSVSKDSLSDANTDYTMAKEANTSCFIQKKDGSVVKYSSLRQVNSVFNSAYLLADGKERIYPGDIKAYQTSDYYAVSQNFFANGHKSHVSVGCLPGFAVRIVKGKLNVYRKKIYNGSRAVDEYFLQAGDDGKIVAYSPAVLKEMVKDNADATSFINNAKRTPLIKKLQATAAIVNSDRIAAKN